MGFYEQLNPKTGMPEPEATAVERKAQGFYAALGKAGKIAGKVTKAAAKKVFADVVTPTADFLGSVLSTPKAALIHYGAEALSPSLGVVNEARARLGVGEPVGPLPPVEFSPTSSYDQLKALGVPHPMVADFLTDLPMAGGMNALGKNAVLPLARAVGEPLRQLPVARDVAEFVKTGASLPKQYRQGAQDILRLAEGGANLSASAREEALQGFLKYSPQVQDAIQTAVETRAVETLPLPLQPAARALEAEYETRVAARVGAGGTPYELGSHLTPEEQAAGVAYTDRPMTKQQRLEARLKAYGSYKPGGLGTGPLKTRSEAGRVMTTPEINAMLEAQGKQRYAPVVEAAFQAGAANDTRVMNLKIVGDLAKKFGQPTANPEESVLRHFGVQTGFSDAMKATLEKTKLPPQVDDLVRRLNERTKPENYGRIAAASKWVNDGFKKWALFSSGYTSRNLQNNVFQIALFEDLGPKELALFGKALKPDKALVKEAMGVGVLGSGQTAQEIAGKMGPVFRGSRKVNSAIEDKSRLWLYLIRRSKGDDPVEAARRVDDILFNYSPRLASKARTQIGRNYVPFVNWSTFIPGLTARAALERPGSVALAGNIRARANKEQGYNKERLSSEFGPWNVPQGVTATGQGKGMVPQFAGQYSVNELVPSGIQDAANKLASKVYPQFGAAFGLAAGRDPFTGRSFEEWGKPRFTKAPSSLRAIFLAPGGPEFAAAHGISIDPDTRQVIAPAKLSFILSKFPQSRIADMIADWTSGVKGKEETAASFGLGVRQVSKYEPKKKAP